MGIVTGQTMKLKHFSIVLLLLLTSSLAWSAVIRQKKLNFAVDTQSLYAGDFHYSLAIISPDRLSEKYSELVELDSQNLARLEGVKLLITKSAYIIGKPVGFFDHQTMSDEKFLGHLMGEQKVQSVGKNRFKITVPGKDSHTYLMKAFFDSDDISTLPNSRVTRAVTQAKKLDVISGSASSIIFQELTNYSRFAQGGMQIRSFISLKENKTLVLSYTIHAIETPFAIKKVIEKNFTEEVLAQKALIESYE
jgi:hypothetical protein